MDLPIFLVVQGLLKKNAELVKLSLKASRTKLACYGSLRDLDPKVVYVTYRITPPKKKRQEVPQFLSTPPRLPGGCSSCLRPVGPPVHPRLHLGVHERVFLDHGLFFLGGFEKKALRVSLSLSLPAFMRQEGLLLGVRAAGTSTSHGLLCLSRPRGEETRRVLFSQAFKAFSQGSSGSGVADGSICIAHCSRGC